ncbi:hypothetical protein PPYR_13995 [Photinus pyralis]|uniref:Methyltransferase domain-containing protein n=1 Tax=Photinus pyralis TaxID=7054 RepID=A0A5N4A3W5_PHOPY|nr:ubiquinone biosynthesis O-methyltransferase, mitochondrial-like [Photinus pyralis]KAB0792034.1 hypothetical protein PPYR_13995 [Photinus pyralis]
MAEVIETKTVNVEHSRFFTAQNNSWWDVNSPLKPLQQLNERALEYIKDVLVAKGLATDDDGRFQLRAGLVVLDAGCGGGILTEPLARACPNVTAIDINRSAIEVAREHAKLDPSLKHLTYHWESFDEHALNNVEKYDVIVCNLVIHFAVNQEDLLHDLLKTLKPGGTIILSSVCKSYEAWLKIIVLGEMVLRRYARGNFRWEQFINHWDLEKILERNHCTVENIRGLHHDVFPPSYQWSENKNVFYFMHATKRQ